MPRPLVGHRRAAALLSLAMTPDEDIEYVSEITGWPKLHAKRALLLNNGDVDKAIRYLDAKRRLEEQGQVS